MATAEPSGSNTNRGGGRGRGRNRPRRGGAQQHAAPHQAADASLALRPASVAPGPTAAATNTENSNANSNSQRGRQNHRGRGGRGGRRGGGPQTQPLVNGQRAFGGMLTSNAAVVAPSLAADAPAFEPGKPVVPRARPSPAPRPRRMSKSQAPDIATRTHEDIANGQSGIAKRAGRFCIFHARRSGQRMIAQLINQERLLPVIYPHQDNGDALAVIFPRKSYPRRIHVGARRRANLDQYPVYHLTLVDKHARSLVLVIVHILVSYFVMPALVLPAA
ncbi:hypothetical protein BP6252_10337 [Coleophoma cylindrospora]|uniref:Uncharacterized protein n=1 Tax=Coleophoma cylindrospora TaxID=1849047 RepID=A0A3D8QS84_9HELO|nr:hypothetical protein BP6252_10337 [Coleophoma cylindrospora]